MSTTFYVYSLGDRWTQLLRGAGQQIPTDEISRDPTVAEIREVLNSLSGYRVTEDRGDGFWRADVLGLRKPRWRTAILVNDLRSDDSPCAMTFEDGDCEVMVVILERLARVCGTLVLRAETSLRAVVIRVGSEPETTLQPWRVISPEWRER